MSSELHSRKSKQSKSKPEPSIDDPEDERVELKLPFTWDEKLFFAITSFIALYEIVFWLVFDYPITLHQRHQTPPYALGLSASLNSIPHLFCGTYGLLNVIRSYKSAAMLLLTKYKQRKQLSKLSPNDDKDAIIKQHKKQLAQLPVHQKGGLKFSIYILYISLFALMQTYFWWLPYFFGIVTSPRFVRMKKKLKGVLSILPPHDEYLVPSAEHTILFPLTVIAWILAFKLFIKYKAVVITQVRTRWVNYGLLASFSIVTCYIPVSMSQIAIKKSVPDGTQQMESNKGDSNDVEIEEDSGAAIIATCLICFNILFYICLSWAPNYKKAAKQERKKDVESKKNK